MGLHLCNQDYTHVLHGDGVFTYKTDFFLWVNVGKYSSTMVPIWGIDVFGIFCRMAKIPGKKVGICEGNVDFSG